MVSVQQCLRVRASTIVWWFKKSDCLRLMCTCPFIDDQASSLYLSASHVGVSSCADHTTTAGLDVPQDSTPSLRFLHQNQLE
ncbi:Major facilitator-type transporter hxnP [Fusarium oxysporum f. sp. albedinis]|nr:Major facilitator-type transporter hxnP [Fusarium oxysporum f. sp. albedinis]